MTALLNFVTGIQPISTHFKMREQLSKLWCTEAYHLIRLAKHNLQIKIV